MRTVFNLLGPLTNPAGADVADCRARPRTQAAELMAGALAALGLRRGFVVHGSDGLDEITTTGPTLAFEIRDGKVERRTLEPADFAVPSAAPADLQGGDQARNLEIASAVLAGERGPQRDIVLVNAAAALVAAGTGGNVPGRHGRSGRVDRQRRGARQGGSAPTVHPGVQAELSGGCGGTTHRRRDYQG